MKTLIIICLIAIIPLLVVAQTSEAPPTKMEEFFAKKGQLLVRDYYELGRVSGAPPSYGTKCVFTAVVIYEPGGEGKKLKGLKIEVTSSGKYEKSKASFLDIEEIESLSEAIGYVAGLASKWSGTEKEYTEVEFSTKGDFQIGFFQKEAKQTYYAANGRISRVSCFLSKEALAEIKELADDGLRLLNAK